MAAMPGRRLSSCSCNSEDDDDDDADENEEDASAVLLLLWMMLVRRVFSRVEVIGRALAPNDSVGRQLPLLLLLVVLLGSDENDATLQ
jgi:hypothetical protein